VKPAALATCTEARSFQREPETVQPAQWSRRGANDVYPQRPPKGAAFGPDTRSVTLHFAGARDPWSDALCISGLF
jgi:hypothetical protein